MTLPDYKCLECERTGPLDELNVCYSGEGEGSTNFYVCSVCRGLVALINQDGSIEWNEEK